MSVHFQIMSIRYIRGKYQFKLISNTCYLRRRQVVKDSMPGVRSHMPDNARLFVSWSTFRCSRCVAWCSVGLCCLMRCCCVVWCVACLCVCVCLFGCFVLVRCFCCLCGFVCLWLCSTSPPGVNQVDGLPPALNRVIRGKQRASFSRTNKRQM